MLVQLGILAVVGCASFSLGFASVAVAAAVLSAINVLHALLFESGAGGARLEFPPRKGDDFHVVIVGSGVGGILMGAKLKMHGFENFTILEKSSRLGGVWDANVYPGVTADVASHLYCFSFAMNPWWRGGYPTGNEILGYLGSVARRFGLDRKTAFGTEVREARWVEENKAWDVLTARGDVVKANVVVAATGLMHVPSVPEFEDAGGFQGVAFHSSRWPEGFDHRGKRLGVIGTGPTAIQLVPELAKEAGGVAVFQRTPNHVAARMSHGYPRPARLLFWMFPFAMRICRLYNFLLLEILHRAISRRGSRLHDWFTSFVLATMRADVGGDAELEGKLLPSYPLGSKRVTPSDDYVAAFKKPSVKMVTERIAAFDRDGIVVEDELGKRSTHRLDAVIYCTGFSTLDSVELAFRKVGRRGKDLSEEWGGVPKAFCGVAYPDFPNLFLLGGPIGACPINSQLFIREAQADYLVDCLKTLAGRAEREGKWSMAVKPEALDRFVRLQREGMEEKPFGGRFGVWFYSAKGFTWELWPFSLTALSRLLSACKEDDYYFS